MLKEAPREREGFFDKLVPEAEGDRFVATRPDSFDDREM